MFICSDAAPAGSRPGPETRPEGRQRFRAHQAKRPRQAAGDHQPSRTGSRSASPGRPRKPGSPRRISQEGPRTRTRSEPSRPGRTDQKTGSGSPSPSRSGDRKRIRTRRNLPGARNGKRPAKTPRGPEQDQDRRQHNHPRQIRPAQEKTPRQIGTQRRQRHRLPAEAQAGNHHREGSQGQRPRKTPRHIILLIEATRGPEDPRQPISHQEPKDARQRINPKAPEAPAAHKAPEPQETPRGISGQEPGRPAAVYIPLYRRNAPRNHGSSPGTQTAPRPPEDTRSSSRARPENSPGAATAAGAQEEPRPAERDHSCFLSRSIFSEIACFI